MCGQRDNTVCKALAFYTSYACSIPDTIYVSLILLVVTYEYRIRTKPWTFQGIKKRKEKK